MIKFLTVEELIKKLEKCPKDYVVSTTDGDCGFQYFEDEDAEIDDNNKTVYI